MGTPRGMIAAFGLVLSLFAPAAAMAQTTSPVGQWACQMTYTELDRFGNRTSGFVREYMLGVFADGSYQAGGGQMAADGYSQFQSQGTWQLQGGQFVARGPEQSTGPYAVPSMFMLVSNLAPDGRSMLLNFEQPDPYGTYVMNRTNTYCERR